MPLTRRTLLSALPALGLTALAPPLRAQAPLSVVATTGMIADAARVIGGDAVQVQALMGPGVDPHSYRSTRTDIVALSRADLVLWHGLYLEAQMEDLLIDLSEVTTSVPVANALPQDVLLSHTDYESRFDPHVWMDPIRWTGVIDSIRAAMAQARPEGAEAFAAQAEAFADEARALDTYAGEVLSAIPDSSRLLVTAHDAFAYFGDRYGIEVAGIQGISTESEAGLARIAEVVDLLVARDVGAVFVETSVSDRNIRALIEGAAARGHEVTIGGELYSDAMGQPGTYEGTWLGMIDHNVTTISRALGGSAPQAGWQGRLS